VKTLKEKDLTMPYANISNVLADADKASILTKLNDSKALLPFLVNLTKDEKRGLQSLSPGNEPFVTKALTYAEANAGLVPPYLNVPEFRKDYNLAVALQALLQVASPLQESMEDTAAAVGHEAYQAALTFYASVQKAAELNVPGADTIADDLAQRFAGQGGSTPPPPPPPTP
jgi:hypothetical protein